MDKAPCSLGLLPAWSGGFRQLFRSLLLFLTKREKQALVSFVNNILFFKSIYVPSEPYFPTGLFHKMRISDSDTKGKMTMIGLVFRSFLFYMSVYKQIPACLLLT